MVKFNYKVRLEGMSGVFFYEEFNDHDLDEGKTPLREKFNSIIKDLKENNCTTQGNIKLISRNGGIKYLRAKLSGEGRLLFTQTKHNNKDIFVILEVIPKHDYENSCFLKSTDKIRSIEIKEIEEGATKKSSVTVEIKDLERLHWLGKPVTFSETQENIVKRVEDCKLPLVISGAAGSGKTSVALESLKKIQENFKGEKILYITKSENLIKESKKLFEYEHYDIITTESETRVPEGIEFLSLHEFLEKRAEGIKGKKPINRNKFFSWFNKICKKGNFKDYEKDGDKIFEEFTAVIAGGDLTKEQYKELGKRQAIFSKEERDIIYSLFEKYKEFIEKDSEYYDPNLTANECTEKKIYDAVVVDEVQDLTGSTLSLILKSLKDESKSNFLLCGDVNQAIHPSFFSLSKLKSFLNQYTADKNLSIYNLQENYRNSKQVIELANRILHLKNCCFAPEDKMTEEEKKLFFMESDTEDKGNVSFITENEKQKEIVEKVSNSTNWAILVLDDESKEDARKLFNTPLVFNIHEAKGLEFKNIILYKFTSHKAYDEIWSMICSDKRENEIKDTINRVRDSYNKKEVDTSRSKDKGDKSSEKYKFYMNALYVGASRAINGVYIMDDKESNLLKVIKPEEIVNIDIKKEESTPEEWKNMALKLIDQGNIEQAKVIEENLRHKGKEEYAEEIMKKLEDEGYYVETQSSDKGKQTISELKTDNTTSQKPSVDKSETSTEQDGKREDKKRTARLNTNKDQNNGQRKKSKESKEDEKKKNTQKLFLVLDKGKLQSAPKKLH
ncbi:MAG: AAA family ATPase [Wolbachia sp.]